MGLGGVVGVVVYTLIPSVKENPRAAENLEALGKAESTALLSIDEISNNTEVDTEARFGLVCHLLLKVVDYS